MDNSYCCVPQCNSRGSDFPRTSFHRFSRPKDSLSIRRREEWIRVLKIGKKITSRMVVCGKHFESSEFFARRGGSLFRTKLKRNAVPSLNLPFTSYENREKLNKKNEDSLIRLKRRENREKSKQQILFNEFNAIYARTSDGNNEDNDSSIHLCDDEKNTESIENEVVLAAQALVMLSKKKTNEVGTQVTSGDLVVTQSFLKKMNEAQLKIMTGLPSLACLEVLQDLLGRDYGSLLRCHQMPLKHQIILVFMRLKLDLTFASLGVLFECTSTTCKNIFKDVIEHLAVHLKTAIQWLPKETVLQKIPKCFTSYKNTRVVLDCTEIVVTKPNCVKCKIMSYSQYKGGHTIKVMIGTSPSGLITFISPVFGGRATDKHIFESSGILEYLEPHIDSVMVDKGFLIDESCANSFIGIIRPPYLREKNNSLVQRPQPIHK